jgi:flavin-binding protein dodecin
VLAVLWLLAARGDRPQYRRTSGLFVTGTAACTAMAVACLGVGAARPAPLVLGLAGFWRPRAYWPERGGARLRQGPTEEDYMSVYRVIDVIGTSTQSWEDAAVTAVNTARKSLRDLRVAEVVEQDLHIEDGGEIVFRSKLRLSFKYEDPA